MAKKGCDYILYIELVLMFLFLTMNASDYWLQQHPEAQSYYHKQAIFPLVVYSHLFLMDVISTVVTIERTSCGFT
ncbi:MAG: hypothetical protein CM15mP83_8660 [Flavobacteriaceae bacterium]|nr:MAG: hypothetical protein CM15mP83_8660 [Flavobacteriaceae bacterium]